MVHDSVPNPFCHYTTRFWARVGTRKLKSLLPAKDLKIFNLFYQNFEMERTIESNGVSSI